MAIPRVNRCVWDVAQASFDHAGENGLSHPAKSQAGKGDTQLDAVHHLIEIAMQFLDGAGADTASLDELLDASIAHAHQGKFCCREKGVGCYQEQDEKHPEQH